MTIDEIYFHKTTAVWDALNAASAASVTQLRYSIIIY